MPPKKDKKGVHVHPEKPPSMVRKQAAEKKQQMKKSKRAIKKMAKEAKRLAKQWEEDGFFSDIEDEESGLQKEDDQPHSSGSKAGASCSLEEKEGSSSTKRFNKFGKIIKVKKPPVTSIKSKKGRKNEESELQESAAFSGNKAGTSRSLGLEGDLQRKKNKWSKKTGDDPTPLQEDSSCKSRKGRKGEESWLQESATFCSDGASSTSSYLGHEVDIQRKKNKWGKKTGDDSTRMREESPIKQKPRKARYVEEKWLPEPATFCSDTPLTSSRLGRVVNLQQKKINKASKKVVSSPTPLQKQTSIKPDSEAAPSPKNITDKKQLTSDVAETGEGYSQGGPQSCSSDKKLDEVALVRTQVEAEKNKSVDEETLEDNSENVSSEVHDGTVEDSTNNRDILQQEADKSGTDVMMSFDPSSLQEKGSAVIGDIKIIPTWQIGGRKGCTYSSYDEKEKMIHIGDENIEISIVVFPGTQVVCHTRRCPGIDSVQSARNVPGGFEGHDVTPERDIDAYSKYCDNTASNEKPNSGSVGKLPSQYCGIEGDQGAYIQDINPIEASEQHDKSATDATSDLSGIGEFSNESKSSLHDKLQKAHEHYLKNLQSLSDKLLTRVENQVKANLSKTSKM